MKLLLCSGEMHWDGWTSIDSNPAVNPDIVGTLPLALRIFDPASVSEIALIHGIEHFYPWEAEELLKECRRILSPGGLLILEQPNIQYAARVLLGIQPPHPAGGEPGQCDMWALYGDPTHRNRTMMHRWGWTPVSLSRALTEAGFERFSEQPAKFHIAARDFRMEAYREG